MITIENRNADPELAMDLLEWAEELNHQYPLKNNLPITLKKDISEMNVRGAAVTSLYPSFEIRMDFLTSEGYSKVYEDSPLEDHCMPVAQRVGWKHYAFAHEWAHVIWMQEHGVVHPWKIPPMCLEFLSLSSYAQTTNGFEQHAECFAEWYHSGGQTSNAATRWFYGRYGPRWV